ncbi:MAG: UvrD-helicase domain-containing protein, partial [Candidatus Omnitrophica bacterium]|nr:UvrD-helicase domain-containing protein [Candidatus Omnitrophota bacterium]
MQTQSGRTTARTPRIFIVEASAGSGKTYALSKRYVGLLLDPRRHPDDIPLRSILAITFTNKAAFEMKGRILELLRRLALDIFEHPAEREELIAFLGDDAPRIRRKARAAMDHLVRNYNFFQVQTIDSFINALLAGCAFKLDLSSKFLIKNDYLDYLRYAIDRLIDRVRVDTGLAGLFREFLHQYLVLEQRTSWFPKQDIMRIIDRLVCSYNTYGRSFSRYPGTASDIFKERRRLRGLLGELAEQLPETTDRRFRESLRRTLAENRSSVSVDELSVFFDRPDFPVRGGARPGPALKRSWASIRRQCRMLVELEALAVFDCYIGLFDRFLVEFSRAARRDNVVFLAELNRTARLLFDEGFVTVPELYLRLACRFDAYLIDEFQDTSSLQWKNIVPLVEDGLARGGSLFYVGDKKQAIYRFRGGEVDLFDSVREEFARFKPVHDVLRTNYRSRREIVAFNNTLFSPENVRRALLQLKTRNSGSALALSDGDIDDIARFYEETSQDWRPDKQGGFVGVESIAGRDEDERSDAVRARLVAAVTDISGRFPYRDIAVLARSNDHVELCAGWLMHAGIPVQSDKTVNIRQH